MKPGDEVWITKEVEVDGRVKKAQFIQDVAARVQCETKRQFDLLLTYET